MKKIILLISLFILQNAFSQEEEVKNYKWEASPKFKEISEEFKKYPAVVLKDYRLYENKVGSYTYKAFIVKHCAIKILTEEGISDNNKVSINKKYVRDYRDLKARIIKPDGKIEELSENKIIQKDNSDERQFAFEGVEKGDIIEYYYVIKDYPEFSGVEYFQRDIPVLEAKFQINEISLGGTYATGYNGMNAQISKNHKIFTGTNLAPYKAERNAAVLANIAKVYYFVDANKNYTYTTLYWSLNDYANGTNANGMIKKVISDLKLDDLSVPLDERLKKMDIYLKENIELDDQDNYKKVVETKKIRPIMVLYFYKDILDQLKIPYNYVASTDRFDNVLDDKNVVPSMLSEILIYIPETKKYLSPFYYWMPYGPPTSNCINNDAVVYTRLDKTNVKHHFAAVDPVSMNENVNVTESEINIGEEMETVTVKKKSSYTGYSAFYHRNVMKYISEDKLKEYIKNTTFNGVDVSIEKFSIDNKEYNFNYNPEKPFTFNTEVKVNESWLENAGKNYIITLGKVLGLQTNLYQETERTLDIQIAYPKKYLHSINLTIPNGYSITKLDNLIFNKDIRNNENKIIGRFISSAKIEGNILKISIEEFYNFSHLEKAKYNQYRDVTNAAYDFYKSSLILTKV